MPLQFDKCTLERLAELSKVPPDGAEVVPEGAKADNQSMYELAQQPSSQCMNLQEETGQLSRNVDKSPFLNSVRGEVKVLAERVARGKEWMIAHPGDVRALRTDEAPQCEGCSEPQPCPEKTRIVAFVPEEQRWQPLTDTGRRAIERYAGLVQRHRLGIRILVCGSLLERAEKRGDDDEGAQLVDELAQLQEGWGGGEQ